MSELPRPRRVLQDGDELVNGAGYVHLPAPISMERYLVRREDSRVGLYFDQDVSSPPSGRLTYQEVREAATQLSQRADGAAEVLRGAHKLALILVNFCRSTHSPKG